MMYALDVQWVHNNQSPWVQIKLHLPSKFWLQNKIAYMFSCNGTTHLTKTLGKEEYCLRLVLGRYHVKGWILGWFLGQFSH
jgi:hypothetical protein